MSIQNKIFRLMLKYRHVFNGNGKARPVIDWNSSIPEWREECERSAAMFGKVPEGVTITPTRAAGLPAEWIVPEGAGRVPVIFYIHGGGYVSGSCSDHRNFVARIAKESGVAALQFEYRLAPEHPYPAALEDTVAAYRWLLDQGIPANRVIVMGESAGGGLCLATLLAIRDQGLPNPAGAVSISPWTDLACQGESYRTKRKVSLAPDNSWVVFSKYYAGDQDPTLPGISPLYGDLHGLPPIRMYTGTDDELVDDSIQFAAKAKAAGVDLTLTLGEGLVHCYPLLPAFIPEARQAMQDIYGFIREKTR